MIDRSGVSHRQKWEAVELKKRVLNAWYWWFRKFRSSQQVKLHLWMILDVVTDLRGWLGNVLQNVRSADGGFISHNFSPPVINRSPMKMRHLWRHRMFDIRISETEWSSPVRMFMQQNVCGSNCSSALCFPLSSTTASSTATCDAMRGPEADIWASSLSHRVEAETSCCSRRFASSMSVNTSDAYVATWHGVGRLKTLGVGSH